MKLSKQKQLKTLWTLLVLAPAVIQGFVQQHPTSITASSKTTCTRLWLETEQIPEPLAEEGTWQAFLDDETTGLIYYFDTDSGESLWEPPTETFPEVVLPRQTQRMAEDLRRDYRRARQAEEEQAEAAAGGGTGGGFFWNNNDAVEDTTQVKIVQEPTAETEEGGGFGIPSWIGGFVEQSDEPQEEEKDQGEGWFGGLFGGADKPSAVTVVKETPKPETTKKQPEEPANAAGGGFFAALLGNTPPTTEATTTVEKQRQPVQKKVVEKKPIVEKKKVVVAKKEPKEVAPKKTIEKQEPKIATKKQDKVTKQVKIEMGSHVLPHPAKVLWGGEDAIFTKGRTFGVFDGVSGADKKDGLPLYSKTLANEMKKSVGKDGISIRDMTNYLADAANYADAAATGASTAVVASIGENGFLQALNVGDSLCMVVRNGKIAAKTREISHYWECPYQLSDDSPDRPRDGTKLNVELIPGDVVIMGSDGIFDNVSDDMLLETVGKVNKPNPSQLARKICDISRKQSTDKNSVTPYGKQAQRRGDPGFTSGLGGKVDDASCVVVVCK